MKYTDHNIKNHGTIKLVRGNTLAFSIRLLNILESPDNIIFSCSQNTNSGDYLFSKTIGDGITNVGFGIYNIRVTPEDTTNANIGDYYWDLELTGSGDVFTIAKGHLMLLPNVKD